MKKVFTILFVLMLALTTAFAQAPQKMSYQAVVRNANNTLVANQNVSVRISVLQGSATGAAVYVETHNVTTNTNGLMTLEVGDGNASTGSFAQVNWANGPFYLKSEIDPEGGINYNVTSTQQLLSVPYALYAANCGNVPTFSVVPTANGYTVNVGDQSFTILNGQDGAQGPAGQDGVQGPAGQDGAQGPAGPQGPQGPAGQDGAQGPAGPQGPQGPAGETGAQGPVGPQGPQGPAGQDGAQGPAGPQGPQGPAGQDGAQGPVGPQGPAGQNGVSPTISTITAGDSTVITITDNTGSHTFVVRNGQQGVQGPVGPQGPQGPVGPQGPQGEQGPAGQDGVMTFQDLTPAQIESLRGATGPQGEPGAQGPQGIQGVPGFSPTVSISAIPNGNRVIITSQNSIDTFTVMNGAVGPQGPQGETGAQGPQGIAGPVGPQGPQGETGATGAVGPQGPQGEPGAQGPAGPQGPQGEQGIAGPVGPQGPQGETGATGPQGPQGIAGQDGFSPIVTVTALDTMRTQVTITDANGPHTFVVKNGSAGGSFVQDQANWTETDATSNSYILNKPTLATVATTGNYNDLNGKPTIPTVPTNVSAFTNDANYITAGDVPAQVNADWNATTGAAQIMNKPNLSTVATTGNYNDLNGKPTIPTVNNATLTIQQDGTTVGTFTANAATNQTVNITSPTFTESQILTISHDTLFLTGGSFVKLPAGFSGNWNDLNGVAPNVSTFTNDAGYITAGDVPAQTQSDWNESEATSSAYIQNKPTNVSAFTNDAGYITTSDVPAQAQANWAETDATSAAYIQNKPEIPEAQVQADWNETDATAAAYIQNKPNLDDYVTMDQINGATTGFVTVEGAQTVTGNKEFSGNNNFTGTVEVPSVMTGVNADTIALDGNCEQAVNFCDLQNVYDNILNKFNALNDQIDNLLDSINDLNKQLNTPKDGEACPNTPTVTDVDGNTYPTVRIGNQCWMRQNLRVLHLPNGTSITPSTAPGLDVTIAGQNYSFDNIMGVTSGATATSAKTQGICPLGWRVPNDADMNELKTYAEMTANSCSALLAPYGWSGTPVEGQNSLGFTAVPNRNGWMQLSTTERHEWDLNTGASLHHYTSSYGVCAVRCIRDNNNGENNTLNAPTVRTLDSVWNITQTSANVKGVKITEDGGMPVTRYGVIYGTNSNLTWANKSGLSASGVSGTLSLPFTSGYYNLSGLSTNTQYYYRAYAINAIDTAFGEVKSFHTVEDGQPCPGLATYQDREGNTYNTIMIGSQCWMKENLKVKKAADNTDLVWAASTINASTAGYRYNWNTAMNGASSTEANPSTVRGICPLGWHLPSKAEWEQLITYAGTNAAKKLAATTGWSSSTTTNAPGASQTSNNTLNFTAVPNFSESGVYYYRALCATESGSESANRLSIASNSADPSWSTVAKDHSATYYYGVRCVKDASTTAQITAPTITMDMRDNTATGTYNYLKEVKYSVSGGTFTLSNYKVFYDTVPHPTSTRYVSYGTAYTSYHSAILKSNLVAGKTYYVRVAGLSSTYGEIYSNEISFVAPVEGVACAEAPTVKDANNFSYSTVKIGSQCWMAQNLRATTYPGNNGSISSYIPNSASSVNSNYGRLYTPAAVLHGSAYSTSTTQGICPNGWHLPTAQEFQTLVTSASSSAKALASTTGWETSTETNAVGNAPASNNAYGFNVYPAGRSTASDNFYGQRALLWGAFNKLESGWDYSYLSLQYNMAQPALTHNTGMTSLSSVAFSVRCVKGATPPSVATSTTVTKTANKATVGGTVYTNGGADVTAVGICYSTTNNPTISDSKGTATAQLGAYTVELTGLSWGATYYYRAYATNANGTQYGEVKSFTVKTLPTVTTVQSSSNVAQTTATVYGNITSLGDAVVSWKGVRVYAYNGSGSTTDIDNYASTIWGVSNSTPLSQTGQYAVNLTGLTPGQYYAVKAEVDANVDGSSTQACWASNAHFFRTQCAPAVTTENLTFTGTTSIAYKLTGTITEEGNPSYTERGFVYSYTDGTPATPTVDANQYKRVVAGNANTFTYSASVSPNLAGKTVYYRAYATNSVGTSYGAVKSFVIPSLATVTADASPIDPMNYSDNVTKNSVKWMFKCGNNGGTPVVESGIVYSTTNTTPTVGGTGCSSNNIGAIAVDSWQTVTVTGLSSNTLYYFRAYVRTAVGYAYTNVYPVKTAINCGQTLYDQAGNSYATGLIGNKCWTKSNMKATSYDNVQTGSSTTPTSISYGNYTCGVNKYYYYPNHSSSNVSTYGNLYNWYAAYGYNVSGIRTKQGICPRGWHVPTEAEMRAANNSMNSTSTAAFFNQFAGYLRCDNNAVVSTTGTYFYFGNNGQGWYWTSDNASDPWRMTVNSDLTSGMASADRKHGMSVRCVQDINY